MISVVEQTRAKSLAGRWPGLPIVTQYFLHCSVLQIAWFIVLRCKELMCSGRLGLGYFSVAHDWCSKMQQWTAEYGTVKDSTKVGISQDSSVQHSAGHLRVGLGQDRFPASAGFWMEPALASCWAVASPPLYSTVCNIFFLFLIWQELFTVSISGIRELSKIQTIATFGLVLFGVWECCLA